MKNGNIILSVLHHINFNLLRSDVQENYFDYFNL